MERLQMAQQQWKLKVSGLLPAPTHQPGQGMLLHTQAVAQWEFEAGFFLCPQLMVLQLKKRVVQHFQEARRTGWLCPKGTRHF